MGDTPSEPVINLVDGADLHVVSYDREELEDDDRGEYAANMYKGQVTGK